MKYGNLTKFENFEEVADELTEALSWMGIENISMFKMDGELKLSFIGRNGKAFVSSAPKEFKDLIDLDTDESLSDYQGIDEETKEVGIVLPVSKCMGVLEEALSFRGRFIEIPRAKQTTEEIQTDVFYLSEKFQFDNLTELIGEQIEVLINTLDTSMSSNIILETVFESFKMISESMGNETLSDEVSNVMNSL